MTYRLSHGDCIELMRAGKAEKIDAIVCDPPYGIEFMGKTWDSPKRMVGEATGISGGFQGIPAGVPRPDMSKTDPLLFQEWCAAWGAEALRVLKPGGHIMAFGGTRMFHRLIAGLEDAGFEIRDTLMWIYGSGFPKGDNIEKGINKHYGVEFESVPNGVTSGILGATNEWNDCHNKLVQVGESHPDALPWRDWNTNLKPAYEPIVLARKPRRIPGKRAGTTKKANTVQCVLEHGTGAINIGACRVGSEQMVNPPGMAAWNSYRHDGGYQETDEVEATVAEGRWPANVILTHHPLCEGTGEDVVVPGDARVNVVLDGTREAGFVNIGAESGEGTPNGQVYGDQTVERWVCHEDCPVRIMDQQAPRAGAIARVTGNQKATTGESGIYDHFDPKPGGGVFHGDGLAGASRFFYCAKASPSERKAGLGGRNIHPTVKPIALMEYLCRLVTPEGGLVLDPFMGSGTTGIAALRQGFKFVGMEQDADFLATAQARINHYIEVEDDNQEVGRT